MEIFHFLHYGRSLVLVFIGFEMVLHHKLYIPIEIALCVVAYTIYASFVMSNAIPSKESLRLDFPDSDPEVEAET